MNKSEDLIEFVEDRPGHDFRYSMNSSKIRNELNWNIKVNFDEGLKKTVDWYFSNRKWWEDIVKESLNQTPWKN
jgi:dTDP-glucose 4,6-dehydratase